MEFDSDFVQFVLFVKDNSKRTGRLRINKIPGVWPVHQSNRSMQSGQVLWKKETFSCFRYCDEWLPFAALKSCILVWSKIHRSTWTVLVVELYAYQEKAILKKFSRGWKIILYGIIHCINSDRWRGEDCHLFGDSTTLYRWDGKKKVMILDSSM